MREPAPAVGSKGRISLKVLHIASFNRWTGAAAPAFAEAEALRSAGIEAHYLYAGGHNLEQRLKNVPWAHPIIEPRGVLGPLRTLRNLARFIRDSRADIVHTHLTNDHILATLVAHRGVKVVRTFHSTRVMRADPGTRFLLSRTDGICVINAEMIHSPVVRGHRCIVTQPPLDTRQFHPSGSDVRDALGVPAGTPLIGFIGKIAPGRGFETAIATLSAVRQRRPEARLMIIGKGPHRSSLEQLANDLGVSESIIWAGYQDEELAQYYRAANVMLFTAAGSDHGHRAILEELGCGTPVVACPLPGVASLLGPLSPLLLASDCQPESLADRVIDVLEQGKSSMRDSLIQQARAFDYAASARRLIDFYGDL